PGAPFVTQVRIARELRPGKVTLRDHDFSRQKRFPLVGAAPAQGTAQEKELEIYRYAPGLSRVELDEARAKKVDTAIGLSASPLATVEHALVNGAMNLVQKKLHHLGVVSALGGGLAGGVAGAVASKIASAFAAGIGQAKQRLAGDDKGFARHD